jgi:hypothetical protein
MKIWLAEYAVFHHRPFIIKHSDENKHYVLACHHGCPWMVHARKGKDDNWRIISIVQPYTCLTNVDNMNHAQLPSRFISQRLVNIIKNCLLMTVTTLIEVVMIVCVTLRVTLFPNYLHYKLNQASSVLVNPVIEVRNSKIKFRIQTIVKSTRISFSSGIQNSDLPLIKNYFS